MPSDQWAVSVLIQEVLSDPDLAHDDVLRRLLQAGLQDLIDAEATAAISAGPNEHSNQRNGKRSKKLATTCPKEYHTKRLDQARILSPRIERRQNGWPSTINNVCARNSALQSLSVIRGQGVY